MRVARALVVVATVVVGVALVAALLFLAQGSLESYPTEEQEGKARLAARAVVTVLALAEAGLLALLRRLRRRETSPARRARR